MIGLSVVDFFKGLFSNKIQTTITPDLISKLESVLFELDILFETVKIITEPLYHKVNTKICEKELTKLVSDQIILILKSYSKPMEIDSSLKPQTVVVCGINGVGKTSVVAKMTYMLTKHDWHVTVGACDTFRSAASDQLDSLINKYIPHKTKFNIIKSTLPNEDPKTIAYRSYDAAKNNNSDILILDTAGRMSNYANLMDELSGIIRTISKKNILAPHNILMVIDGSTGKNAISQITEFSKIVKINGLIVTKLDGQNRCGILLSIVEKFGIPIHGFSNGENIDDLHDFTPEQFTKMLFKIRS